MLINENKCSITICMVVSLQWNKKLYCFLSVKYVYVPYKLTSKYDVRKQFLTTPRRYTVIKYLSLLFDIHLIICKTQTYGQRYQTKDSNKLTNFPFF